MKPLIATVLLVVLILLYSGTYIYYNVDLEPLKQLWYIQFAINLLTAIWYIIVFVIFIVVLTAALFG